MVVAAAAFVSAHPLVSILVWQREQCYQLNNEGHLQQSQLISETGSSVLI